MDVKVVYSNNKHDWHDELNDDDEYGAVVVDGWQMDWEYLEDFDYLIPIVRNSIAALDKAQVYLIVQMNSP